MFRISTFLAIVLGVTMIASASVPAAAGFTKDASGIEGVRSSPAHDRWDGEVSVSLCSLLGS